MQIRNFVLTVLIVVTSLFATIAHADEFEIPFGLKWGQTRTEIEKDYTLNCEGDSEEMVSSALPMFCTIKNPSTEVADASGMSYILAFSQSGMLSFYIEDTYFGFGALEAVFAGTYVDDKRHGEWKIYERDGGVRDRIGGSFYTGSYVDGKRQGEWKRYERRDVANVVSTVPYVDDKKHGEWKKYDKDGNVVYTVPYVDDKRHGEWKRYDRDGNVVYTVPYVDDRIVSAGPYVDGKKHGKWIETDATETDDNIIRNSIRNGRLPHDDFSLSARDDFYVDASNLGVFARYEGGGVGGYGGLVQWRTNDRGEIITSSPIVSALIVSAGPYVDGKKHGMWETRRLLRGDVVSAGSYVDGKKHGRWEEKETSYSYKYISLYLSAGSYVNGKKHGRWEGKKTYYYDEKTLLVRYAGSYVDGKKHGRWKEEEGLGEVAVGSYVNGKRHGMWEFKRDGGRKSKKRYNHGRVESGGSSGG